MSHFNVQQKFLAGIIFCILSLYLTRLVEARVYPWVSLGEDDIQVVVDPLIEAQLRLDLIRSAQKSIDIVTFDQRGDEIVGIPLLIAIEDAAARGVKVRFASSWIAPAFKDLRSRAGNYMARIANQYKHFQFALVGGFAMWKKGWGFLDGIHQKLFIIDGKWLLTTGRGHGAEYLGWMDTGFVIKGHLVRQSISSFDLLWEKIIEENGALNSNSEGEPYNDKDDLLPVEPRSSISLSLTPEQHYELNRLMNWIYQPSSGQKEMLGRLLYHEFFRKMRSLGGNPYDYSYQDRIDLMRDPIVDRVIHLLAEAKDFKLSILSVVLPPALKQAILAGLRRGMNVEVFTNSNQTHRNIVPLSIAMGWYAGLPDLSDLLMAGVHGFGLKSVEGVSSQFLHRKLAIIDDTVLLGSHNLTMASSYTQDEISFEIYSPTFAEKMRTLFQKTLVQASTPLNREAVYEEATQHGIKTWLGEKFKWFYMEEQ